MTKFVLAETDELINLNYIILIKDVDGSKMALIDTRVDEPKWVALSRAMEMPLRDAIAEQDARCRARCM